ncbi:MAG: NHLP family bacteriocin export ABC transporter peptidase/permease/ATPase subunit [Eubacteriales bacterium]|nr:NHLP family bacteriocin export ABC transporter peptidase/permease/ATPase subunit [Eubacteriales bacterium]MDD3199098.1 NHLP family bacteriocin export ABC transporter peptidase/permease/ATPase subunit [Eubacteriales bacterium]MDD4629659.1 NHLP family bacteriocin export ABC transporter peptidase/permease/ATPase subunit [Eubacteriales bacterium]
MSKGKKAERVRNYAAVSTILQMEATECGAASLAMILARYKAFVPLEQLRSDCGINRDGSKASNIIKAARNYGLDAKGYRMEPEGLKTVKMPCILHWNFNHFIVLEGFKNGKVYINDPASGKKVISEEQLDMSFTGVVLTFEPGPEFKAVGVEPQLYRALVKRLKGSEQILSLICIAGLFLVIPGLVIPTFSKIFIDDVLLGGKDYWLRALVWGMVITGIIQVILTYVKNQYLLKMQTKIAIITSGKFLWHVLRLPVQFFSQRYAGDISQRMQSNDSVAAFLSGQLASTVINCVMLVFYFVLMLCYSWKLTMVALAAAAINMGYLKYIAEKREDQNSKLQQDSGRMMGTAMGGLQIIETLKASGAEGDFFAKVSGYHAKNITQQQVFGVSTQYLNTLPVLLTSLTDAAVLILGGFEVMGGIMTVGTLIAFRTLMSSFMSPITMLMQIGTQYQEMKADINRLDDVLNYEEDAVFQRETPKEEMYDDKYHKKLEGYVDIKGLNFGYSPLEPPLIENFEVHMKPGSRVALVGGSGSGKSTVSKLITGIYEPWSGEILFDGQNRKDISRTVLANSVAVVDQDICMFSDTIKNNLTLWDEVIPEEMIMEAARDAEIYDTITEKIGGFEYKLAEGGKNLSGGQRQRVEIARALMNKPTILIMDEATSALDPVTEKKIADNIREKGITCIIVAHRLSTIRDCDEIIVLSKGKIVQRGTHDELKDQEGYYAELIRNI